MIKKVISVGLIIVMFFGLISGCAWENKGYIYSKGDLVLEIFVDKTEASIDDEIEVTAVFKNLSGRNLKITQIGKSTTGGVEDYCFTFFHNDSGLEEKV